MYLRWLAIIVVALIISSRVYLGVHSVADVIAGLCFGLIILLWWKLNITQSVVRSWFNGKVLSYWGLVITTFVIYFITTDEDSYSSMLVASVGILIGYGLSLRSISKWHYVPGMFSVYHIGSVILSYAMLAILVAAIPTINFNDTTKIVSGILKSGH